MEANDLLANGGCFEVKNAADFNTTVDHLLSHPDALQRPARPVPNIFTTVPVQPGRFTM